VKLVEETWKTELKDTSGKAVWTDSMVQK
jgi:hypothetical protein